MKKKYQTALQMLVQLLSRPSVQVTVAHLEHDLRITKIMLLFILLVRNKCCQSCCSWYKLRAILNLSPPPLATSFPTTPSP